MPWQDWSMWVAMRRICFAGALFALTSGASAQGGKAAVDPASTVAATFARDVLPILQKHCQECHRPNRVAPMSLIEYSEVRPWAKAIRNSVVSRTMPPFHVNAPLGHFKDDIRLTDEQIATIAKWVDTGAPQGNPADAPPAVVWPSGEWLLGDPDLVLPYPVYSPNTNNLDEVIVFFSDYVFPQETWVQSFEFKATNYRVLHHAGVYSVGPEFFVPEDKVLNTDDEHLSKFGGKSSGSFALMKDKPHLYTWLPGQQFNRRAEGDGFRIKAGNRLVIQLHVAPTTEAIQFQISLGLHFVNGEITTDTIPKLGRLKDFSIPPGAPAHRLRTEIGFDQARTVIGFNAHMHVRGKSTSIVFHYPDGRTETVFDLPHYNFDWQRDYYLAKPMQVPAGTRAEFIAEWDNSVANPLNPDPAAEVKWGAHNTDEMYDGLVYATGAREKPLRVVKGIVQP